jgi:hypothetical protein
MKRMMKAGLLIALIASASATLAGGRSQIEVFLDKPGRYAEGTLVDARGSSDSLQRIGCYAYSSNHGACIVTDSTGKTGSCYSVDPGMVQAMRSLDTDSYLFIVWDANNVCTTVFVEKSSTYRPGSISGF